MADFTFGSGGDYSNWYEVIEKLDTDSPLSEDYTFTQISSTSDTQYYSGSPIDMGGYTVTITVAEENYHRGVPDAGYVSSFTDPARVAISIYNGTFRMERVSAKRVSGNNSLMSITCPNFQESDKYIDKLLINGNGEGGLLIGNAFDNFYITNSKIYNCDRAAYDTLSTYSGTPATKRRKYFVNCTADNSVVGFEFTNYASPLLETNFINCVAVNCTDNFREIASGGAVNLTNCAEDSNSMASLNATVTNPQYNIVDTTEFESLVNTDSNYLFITSDGVLYNSGIAPTYSGATDIALVQRPGLDGFYAIGCHEPITDGVYYLFTPVHAQGANTENIQIGPISQYFIRRFNRVYVDNVIYKYDSKYTSRKTGLEKVKCFIHDFEDNNTILNIYITFVSDLPICFKQKMVQLARAINGAGMNIEFRDDFATNYTYRGKWVNALDFIESSELLSSGTMHLMCYYYKGI